MAYCSPCNRSFVSQRALQQHLDNSDIHAEMDDFLCGPCNRLFDTENALRQHEQYSMEHLKNKFNYVCEPCRWGCRRKEDMENHDEDRHYWCRMHDRFFENANNLRQHMASRAHLGQIKPCPFCNCSFPTLTAVTLHMESGSCEGGMNRRKVDQEIHRRDRGGVITNQKLIGYGNWEEEDVWVGSEAWNGRAYGCYLCENQYSTLGRLNGHITRRHAQKRTQELYHCPGRGCGRQFKLFSQLMGHVEHTGSCKVKEDTKLKDMLGGGVGQRTLRIGYVRAVSA